jgi:ketol-acid reductoisomerase
MVLLPDEKQAEVFESEISDGIAPGNLLMFAHGFSIHFGQIDPRARRSTWAWSPPKGPGHLVRPAVRDGNGVPGASWRCIRTQAARRATRARVRARIGCTRALA